MALISLFLLCPGVVGLEIGGAFSRPFTFLDIEVAGGAMIFTFCFLLVWIFLRGKTEERTLTISELGISTKIGSHKGQVAWDKVSRVSDALKFVLIVGTSGNAFFVPSRAFNGPAERAKFIAEIAHWRKI
jgi:hypothetical protein